MNLNIYGLVAWVQALADNARLNVEFYPDDEQGCPATNGKTLFLNKPKFEWGKDEVNAWMYAVYHEIGHNVPRNKDIFKLMKEKKIDTSTFFGGVVNILDDFRQEYYKHDEYLEKRRVSEEGRNHVFKDKSDFIKKISREKPTVWEDHPEFGLKESLWIPDNEHRDTWQAGCYFIADEMRKILPKKYVAHGDKLSTPEWKKKYLGMETADDVYKLAKEIIDDVFKMDSEAEEKKSKESFEKKEEAKKKTGKGKGKGEKKDSSEERRKLLDKLGKGESISTEELLEAADMDIHIPEMEKIDDTEMTGSGSSGHHSGRGPWQPLDKKQFDIYDKRKLSKLDTHRPIEWSDSKLGKKVKRMLLVEKQSRHLYGQKKGKIHNKNLYRATIKAPGFNERIMRRKDTVLDVDVAVSVLVDCSGSMSGSKYVCAANSAISFIEALQAVDIPVQVNGFTDTNRFKLFEFKRFDERANIPKVKEYFEAVYRKLANNDDPDAVYYAYNQIKTRPESRKILITLSDGSPASSYVRSDIGTGLKDLIAAIDKEGIVETYAIGMLYDGVNRWYPRSETIDKIENLEAALLKLIHRKIIKHT